MSGKRLMLEFDHIPGEKDIQELLQLAKKLKAIVTTAPKAGIHIEEDVWAPLPLNVEPKPDDLSKFTVKEEDIRPLIALFAEDAPAEELCNLLD